MALVEALVSPEVLVWARTAAGYTVEEVAHKVPTKASKVESWEKGDARPTIGQAKKLASVYKRPLAIFYLPSPPETEELPPDHRGLSVAAGGLSPRLRYEVRTAHFRREVALELLRAMGEEPTPFTVTVNPQEGPELAAQDLRALLGVTMEQQLRWSDPVHALRAWVHAAETLGILVFQTLGGPWGVEPEEARGASLYDPLLPVILLTGRDYPNPKIFTLMHEYTHLALHTSGVCDWDEHWDIEVFCNRVAGEILVPRDHFSGMLDQVGLASGDPADDQIEVLASHYRVSREVVVRRLLILGKVSRTFYEQKRAQYQEEFQAYKKRMKEEERRGYPQWYVQVLKSNGPRFTGLVLDAHYAGNASLVEVSRYLDMDLKHFDRLEKAVMATR